MEDISELFCNNCKKNIGAANFSLHSIHCVKNLKICEVCDESVPKNLMKEHEEENHITVKCDMCKNPVKKYRLSKHQEFCVKRRVVCEFCEADFPFDEFEEHKEFCGSRTEKCPNCSTYVMFKHKNKHMELHAYEERFRRGSNTEELHQNTKNEYINRTYKKDLKLSKTSTYSEKNNFFVADSLNADSIVGATAPAHEKQESKKISDDFTKCHLCREYILWDEYDLHIANCSDKNDFKKCPHCDEFVPPFAWKDHSYKTCGMKENLKTQISKSEFETECRSLPNYKKSELKDECRSQAKSESKTDYKSISHSFFNDHSEDDHMALCPHCKELWPHNTMYEHLKFCPEKYFQCDLCFERVLSKDRDTHINIQCKKMKERILSDYYECPLCGETMPEKDKASHESFSCRTLLRINQGQIYTLPNKQKPRSSLPEPDQNPTEPCMNCKKAIPLYELSHHKKICKKIRYCAYCDKELYGDEPDDNHLKICDVYQQIINLKDDERDFDHTGAKPKQAKLSDSHVKPKVGKCSYCNTTLNQNILLFHEKECIYQTIRCPDCYASMLLKCADRHHCKQQSKGRDKGTSGRGGRKTPKTEKQESKNTGYFSSMISKFLPGNSSNAKPTLDEHQNDRNEFYASQMVTESTVVRDKNEDLYFEQQHMIDEPKIPCEFCNEPFPASEIVVHTTGCNPDEVSLPKPISAERLRENEASSRNLKRSYDFTNSSEHLFSAGRGTSIPPSYESLYKRLERSNTKPGQYLPYSSEDSPKFQTSKSEYERNKGKNQSSTLASVWNNDSLDVEMEETDLKPSSKSMAQNTQENIQEQAKSSHEISKCSADSDEEVSNMIDFIQDHASESEKSKEENFLSAHMLDKDEEIMSENHTENEYIISKVDTSHKEEKSFKYGYPYSSHAEENSAPDTTAREIKLSSNLVHNKMRDSDDFLSEYIVSKKDTGHKEEKSFKSAYHYSSLTEENSAPEKAAKEITLRSNIFHNKMKDSDDDNDEFSNYSKSRMYHYKKNIHKTDSVSEDDEYKIRRSKEMNKLENVQKSKNENCDVYYKTNALGYAIVSGDDEIRRSRENDPHDVGQNNALGSKYMHQDDNTTEIYQKEISKFRMQNVSPSLPEKPFEVSRSKYKHEDSDEDEDQHESKTQNVSASKSEVLKEVSRRSKYMHEDVDKHERFKCTTQDASALKFDVSKETFRSYGNQNDSFADTNFSKLCGREKNKDQEAYVALQSKYMHQDDNAVEICQKEMSNFKIEDLSPSLEKIFEVSRSKYKHDEDVDQRESKNKSQDVSVTKPEISKKTFRSYSYQKDSFTDANLANFGGNEKSTAQYDMLKLKYMHQEDEDDDIQTNKKEKSKSLSSSTYEKSKEINEEIKSKHDHAGSSVQEKPKDPSRYYTICPICKENVRWIDYNTHVPVCASNAGRCSRCGEEVSSSNLKEHFFMKCPGLRKGEPVREKSQQVSSARVHSYEQVLHSLTSTESARDRKSRFGTGDERNQFENARMRTSASRDTVNCTKSSKNRSESSTEQAYKTEQVKKWPLSEANYRKHDTSEIPRDFHQEKPDDSQKSFSPPEDEDLPKWMKWNRHTDV